MMLRPRDREEEKNDDEDDDEDEDLFSDRRKINIERKKFEKFEKKSPSLLIREKETVFRVLY